MGAKEDKIAELEAALAAKDVELKMAKATAPGASEISAARQIAQNNEQRNKKRAELMASTKRTTDGRRHYHSGDSATHQPNGIYVDDDGQRHGGLIPANTVFSIPEDDIPSVTWHAVDRNGNRLGDEPEPEVVEPEVVSPKGRASDQKLE